MTMMSQCIVRWADGTYDHQRDCSECHGGLCVNQVHGRLTSMGDGYKEIITKKTYWEWLEKTNQEGNRGITGMSELIEPSCSNPDVLEGFDDVTE